MFEKKIYTKTVISPNLLPPEIKEELSFRTVGDIIKKVVMILSAMLFFLWMIGGVLLWKIKIEEDATMKKLETEIDTKKLWDLGKMNEQFKELRALTAKVDRSLEKEYQFSGILGELAKITPQGVILTDFETSLVQPGWVKIKGTARNRDAFLAFKKRLEESEFYEKVDSPPSNYVSPENLVFELNVLLKDWKPAWEKDLKKKPAASSETEEAKE